jgi:hypothetical protein
MARGNRNPVQTDEFKQKRFKAYGEVDKPLGGKVFGIRLPIDVEATLNEMPDKERVAWMRKTLAEAARKNLTNRDDVDLTN